MEFVADLFQGCNKAIMKWLLFHRVSINTRFVKNDKLHKEEYELIVSESF